MNEPNPGAPNTLGDRIRARRAAQQQQTTAPQRWQTNYVQTNGNGTREIGYGDNPMGCQFQHDVTVTTATFRVNTASDSGSLFVELQRNGAALPGASATLAAIEQTNGGSITGSWDFVAGDVLTVYISAIGDGPGLGLAVDIAGIYT